MTSQFTLFTLIPRIGFLSPILGLFTALSLSVSAHGEKSCEHKGLLNPPREIANCQFQQQMYGCSQLKKDWELEDGDSLDCDEDSGSKWVEGLPTRNAKEMDELTAYCLRVEFEYYIQAFSKTHQAIRACETSANCKDQLTEDLSQYRGIPSKELRNLSVAQLRIEISNYQNFLAQLGSGKNSRFLSDLAEEAETLAPKIPETSFTSFDQLISRIQFPTPEKVAEVYRSLVQHTSNQMFKVKQLQVCRLTPLGKAKGVCGEAIRKLPAGEAMALQKLLEKNAIRLKASRGVSRNSASMEGTSSSEIKNQSRRESSRDESSALVLDRSPERKEFIAKYGEIQRTTREQNQAWIRAAEASDSSKEVGTFLNVENARLKWLNDSLKDKSLATALTNKHSEILFKKIDELRKKNPQLEILPYSDYKGTRFFFRGERPSDFEGQLKKVFAEADDEYRRFLKTSQLVREEDFKEPWFRGGLGDSADLSELAARRARDQGSGNELVTFPEVKSRLEKTFKATEDLRRDIQSRLEGSDFLEDVGNGKKVPRADIVDVVRKSPSVEELSLMLSRMGSRNVDVKTAEKLKTYVESINHFQLGNRTATREYASLAKASRGGASVDFAGLGAENLRGTAQAMAQGDNLENSVRLIRREEAKVTERLTQRKKQLTQEVKNYLEDKKLLPDVQVNCSGDDCIFFSGKSISPKMKAELVQRLSKQEKPASIRVAFVSDRVVDETSRVMLSTHGEAVEKILRSKLTGQISSKTLNQILFSVDMQGQRVGEGGLRLLVGNSQVPLAEAERQRIQRAFTSAVSDLNEVLKKTQKGHSGYTVLEP